ncbi:MAG: trigger factor, partial [Bacteroidota bacterium]
MAKVTRENIAKLTDKLTVTLEKTDYLGNFEVSLKKYAKTANIPGFRKGMVPAGLVKKMYGQSVFTDEVLKTVEQELNSYLQAEQLDIFAQPLPLDSELRNMDINNPESYTFAFEIGLKPAVDIDVKKVKVTRYKINITDQMLQDELERLQIRSGKMTEPEEVTGDDNVLNVKFVECDKSGAAIEGGITKDNSLLVKYFEPKFRKNLIGKKNDDSVVLQLGKAFEAKEKDAILADLGLTDADADKYFSLQITKVGLVEKAEMNAEFFASVYPNAAIATAEEFTAEVKKEMETYYDAQSRNQIHDQIYHHFVDHTPMELP